MSTFSNLLLAKQTLQKYFHYQDFRPKQTAIVQSILNQHDTLAILATGGGKSICFQIPGLIFAGTTLVISPLISLMKDQVAHLAAKKIPASFLNSSLDKAEQQQRLKNLAKQKYKFFYLAPERLDNPQLIKICQAIKIPLLVIDEAHCISLWGHNFRPNYLKINHFIKQLQPRPTVASFTATATPLVIKDIKQSLKLNHPQLFINSFVRPNLQLIIYHCQENFLKEILLFCLLKKHLNQAGIIYTATRKEAERLYQLIKNYDFKQQFKLAFYHGGLDHRQRDQIQEDFLTDKIKIIIATNAFGMGVDKSNIRFVIHYQIPGCLENYSQEIGRAGRDQQAAVCYLLFYQPDILIQQQFIANKKNLVDQQQIEQTKLKKMLAFVTEPGCLQQKIAQYFQQKPISTCNQCSNCVKPQLPIDPIFKQRYIQLHQTLSQLAIEDFPIIEKTQLLLALHQPQNKDQLLKIAGVGRGLCQYLNF